MLQSGLFSLKGFVGLLVLALRLPNRCVVLIELPHRLGNLQIFLRDCASELGDLIFFILHLAGQPDREVLLRRSLGLEDFILGPFPGRLAQLVCHLVYLLGQHFDFLLHDLAIDLEPSTFFYLAVGDGNDALE